MSDINPFDLHGRRCPTSSDKGKVALVGLGLPNQMREYVKDGTVKAFALWGPAKIGTAAVYAAKALVAGTITGKEGDSFDAGDLGTLKVGADSTVIVGPPTEFDVNDIDKFDFSSLRVSRAGSPARETSPSPPAETP